LVKDTGGTARVSGSDTPLPNIKSKIQLIDVTAKSGERLRIEDEFTINDITLINKAFMEASA
jgi:hypothetical protein